MISFQLTGKLRLKTKVLLLFYVYLKLAIMLLEIHDNMLLGKIQEKFTESFPFLKIAFYREAQKKQQTSGTAHPYAPDLLVGTIRKMHEPAILEVKSWDKTVKVEKKFKKQCGLNVKIFRRQGSGWIPASGDRGLTLQQQSDRSKASVESSGQEVRSGDEEVYYEVS